MHFTRVEAVPCIDELCVGGALGTERRTFQNVELLFTTEWHVLCIRFVR
jgi:hypothetical protein